MKNEIWKDIAGYEGLYQVSSFGRVKSFNYRRTGKEQCLKPTPDKDGYLKVTLRKNGKGQQLFVHRLVAEAFIPNPNNLPEINHKDENPENNCVSNLEWISHKDNIKYGTRNERVAKKLRNRKDQSKPVLCVESGKIYTSQREAARQTGAYQTSITQCCRGKLKTTKGYHWRYAN